MKLAKRLFAAAMCLAVAFGCCAFAFTAHAEDYTTGDIIEFGTYPQSEVKDADLIEKLNNLGGDWVSYGYYTGTGDWTVDYRTVADGQMTASDYMQYKDVNYGGARYRGVKFSAYRPYSTTYTSDTYQDENGYSTNYTYWFRYEPLEWRVLDPSSCLVMCETIIDSQPYNNYILYADSEYWGDSAKTYYSSDYEHSSIRQWLNDDFYNTAFSDKEKERIQVSQLDNRGLASLIGMGGLGYDKYDSGFTEDKVFLLSYTDVTNGNYGFYTGIGGSQARRAKGSDYAMCQGLYEDDYPGRDYDECSDWLLRTPGDGSSFICWVKDNGCVDDCCDTCDTGIGVRPALHLQNLEFDTTVAGVVETSDIEDSPAGNEEVNIDGNIENANDNVTSDKTPVIIIAAAAAALALIIVAAVVLTRKKSKSKAQQAVTPPAEQTDKDNKS